MEAEWEEKEAEARERPLVWRLSCRSIFSLASSVMGKAARGRDTRPEGVSTRGEGVMDREAEGEADTSWAGGGTLARRAEGAVREWRRSVSGEGEVEVRADLEGRERLAAWETAAGGEGSSSPSEAEPRERELSEAPRMAGIAGCGWTMMGA